MSLFTSYIDSNKVSKLYKSMNINRTNRLTIVDKKWKIYQTNRAKDQIQLKIAQKDNVLKLVSQAQKKAA